MTKKDQMKKAAKAAALNGYLWTSGMCNIFGWSEGAVRYHKDKFVYFQPGPNCIRSFELQSVLDYIENHTVEE